MKGSFLRQVRQQTSVQRRFAALLVLACGTSALACPAVKGKMVNGALPSLLPHLIPVCRDELWPFSETLRKWKITEDLQARWVEVYKIPTSQSSQAMANLTKVLTSPKYGYQWRGEFEGYAVSKSTAYKSAVTGKGLWITTLNMGPSVPFTAVAIIGTDRIIDSPKVGGAASFIAVGLAEVVPTPSGGVGGNPGAARYYRPPSVTASPA